MSLSERVGLLLMLASTLFMFSLVSAASVDYQRQTAAAENETLPHHQHDATTIPDARTQNSSRVKNPEAYGSTGKVKGLHHRSNFDTSSFAGRVGPFSAGPWQYAHATFYGDETAQETMQGACGYQNLWQQGYGSATTALSTTLFNGGFACGSCFEIRCVASWACYAGNPSTKVTATNFCPPNWARPTNNGGWCNPPRQHFDMAKPAFEKIAYWRAGIVPIAYRRIPCAKQGNMDFLIEGNQWWHIVFITNVGGPGDIGQVYLRGSNSNQWVRMIHNWGTGYQVFHNFLGESLSFMVVSNTNYETVVSWNMVPSNWQLGRTYAGGQFQLSF
ncbi:unnamed protein product [Calypogeia fissa]